MPKSESTFTYRKIRALKPRNAPYRHWESGSDSGFNIQILPTGVKTFSLCYRFDGKRKFLSLGRFDESDTNDNGTLKAARKRVREARALIDDDVDPRTQAEDKKLQRQLEEEARKKEASKGSVEQLFDLYCKNLERKGKPSHRETRRALYKDALPYIGKYDNGKPRKANEVKSSDITRVLAKVCNRKKYVMANRLRSYLAAAYNFGLKCEHDPRNLKADVQFHLEANPVSVVGRPLEEEEVRERALDADEIHELWRMLDNGGFSVNTKTILKLILATGGQRVKEVAHAEWTEIDLQKGIWLIPKRRTKNRKHAHAVPLNKLALSLLNELQAVTGRGKYLFPVQKARVSRPVPEQSISKTVRRLCKQERFEPFTPRDLRRTVKTMFAEMGVEKEIRDRIMNHALRGDVSERHYNQHDYLKEKQVALNKWGARLTRIINGTETNSAIIQFPV